MILAARDYVEVDARVGQQHGRGTEPSEREPNRNGLDCRTPRPTSLQGVVQSDYGPKVRQVDTRGSRVLEVRLALGGKVGVRVTLLSTEEPDLRARIGEAGEVKSINENGTVTVDWDRGDESTIDVLNSRVEVHS